MRVRAVVVLYHPEPGLLGRQHRAVVGQVEGVVYVDNGGGRDALAAAGIADATVVGDGVNAGLGVGVNRGVAAAGDVDAVLLLDQDSVPADGMVAALADLLAVHDRPDRPVGAIGPAIWDELRDRVEFFVRMRPVVNERIRTPADTPVDPFDVDFLVTSGSLVPLHAWRAVGGMDEDMFIDSLDFEWGFRALSRGHRLLATFGTRLSHRRGDEVVHVPVLPPIRVHSIPRVYSMHRSRVMLYRRAYVPLSWKVHDVGRFVAKLLLLLAFTPHRRATLSAVVRGLRDGLLGRPTELLRR